MVLISQPPTQIRTYQLCRAICLLKRSGPCVCEDENNDAASFFSQRNSAGSEKGRKSTGKQLPQCPETFVLTSALVLLTVCECVCVTTPWAHVSRGWYLYWKGYVISKSFSEKAADACWFFIHSRIKVHGTLSYSTVYIIDASMNTFIFHGYKPNPQYDNIMM